MNKLIKMLVICTLAAALCACSIDTTKSDIQEKTEALLEAIQSGDYNTAVTYVESDTVLSRAGYTNYSETFADQVVSGLSATTGVTSIEDYDPALKAALDKFAQLFLSKMMKSYTVNDDFKKISDTEVTITADVQVLSGDVTSFTEALSSGKESGSAFSTQYLKDHPEVISEFNTAAKSDLKAAYKKYFETHLTAYFGEQGEVLFQEVFKTYADKVWTITYKKANDDWLVTKIIEAVNETPATQSSEDETTEETSVEENSTEETTTKETATE